MSSCELPLPGASQAQRAKVSAKGSRIHRFQAAATGETPHLWEAIPLQEYKPSADHHCGVMRQVLIGDAGEKTSFQVRYFEIAPHGNTTLEHHAHEHVVVVLRGRGQLRLDEIWYELSFGDAVYVAPHEVHQLRNAQEEPFGFLCMVDAERDRPIPVQDHSESTM